MLLIFSYNLPQTSCIQIWRGRWQCSSGYHKKHNYFQYIWDASTSNSCDSCFRLKIIKRQKWCSRNKQSIKHVLNYSYWILQRSKDLITGHVADSFNAIGHRNWNLDWENLTVVSVTKCQNSLSRLSAKFASCVSMANCLWLDEATSVYFLTG